MDDSYPNPQHPDGSDATGFTLSDDRYSLNKEGNSMLRDRALGPNNVKVNKSNGYNGDGSSK